VTGEPRILVVDDEPLLRDITSRLLQGSGYQVAEASTGQECLSSIAEDRPDLVLLDVVLPDIDGIELCKHIKSDPEQADIYVVLLSSSRTASDVQARGLEEGADGYIARPISNREFLARVQSLLRIKRTEEALRESRQFLQSTLDSLSAHIAILDETGTIVTVNRSWRRFADQNGLAWADYGIGRNYLAVLDSASGVSSEGSLDAARGIREVISSQRDHFRQEYPCHSPTEKRWFAMSVTGFHNARGHPVVVSHENITERKLAEEALRAAKEAAEQARREEEKRRQIAESLRDILSVLNSTRALDAVLDYIVLQAERLLGSQAVAIYRSQGEAGDLVLQAAEGLPDGSPADAGSAYAGSAYAGVPGGMQALEQAVQAQRPVAVSGTNAPSSHPYRALLAVPIIVNAQSYGGMVLFYVEPRTFTADEIELAVLFATQVALAIENARLRDQLERAAVTAERSRLARELHDAVTQTLFSASLIAETVPRVWKRYPDEAERGLEELRQLTRGALAEMRALLLELRPAALTEKPLSELLRHLVEATTSRTRVPITLAAEGEEPLPPEVQVVLYRIAQEALNNVAKHAEASQATVTLHARSGRVTLRIQDNGCGFDLEPIPPGHLGLGIMRERAASVGANLEIKSRRGQGTEVIVRWEQKRTESDERV
jgi:signal transduction histidine kinase/CheY-like chemotaxis protein